MTVTNRLFGTKKQVAVLLFEGLFLIPNSRYNKFRRIANPPKFITHRLNNSGMYMLIGFIFHTPELRMTPLFAVFLLAVCRCI